MSAKERAEKLAFFLPRAKKYIWRDLEVGDLGISVNEADEADLQRMEQNLRQLQNIHNKLEALLEELEDLKNK